MKLDNTAQRDNRWQSDLPPSQAQKRSDDAQDRAPHLRGADGPSWAPHRAFTNDAHAHFGNRIVGEALRGEAVEGPGSIIHTVVALGAAGVHIGDGFLDVVPNSRMGEVLGDLSTEGAETEVAAPTVTLAARLQRRQGGPASEGNASTSVQAALQAGGRPLPAQVRADLERRFGGVSFAGVRIHTDGRAARAAEAVQAEAFTVGQQIWFSRGAFSPETRSGMHLLTHELTHVLQNRQSEMISGGTQVNGVAVSAPSDAREREAEAVAHEVSRVEAAPEVNGPGDALSQLASRWSVELSAMTEDSGGGESVLASGAPSAEVAGITAQRSPGGPGGPGETGPTKSGSKERGTNYKHLPDGTKVKIEDDGSGGWFLRGPDGEKVACDDQGTPLPDAEAKLPEKDDANEGEDKAEEEKKDGEETDGEDATKDGKDQKGEGEEEQKDAQGEDVAVEEGGGPAGLPSGGSDGPPNMDILSKGPLAPYMHEKSWHESWSESGAQEGGLNTMDTGDKGSLVLNALGSGAAEGLVNGVQALVIDTILNKATKRIPYASGFIGAYDILKNPGEWWANSFANPAAEVGELWGGDWLDKLEAILNVADMLNTVISTASTLCLVVAGAGFIISLFFPPLLPFVAMAAKWGLLLGEISTIAGLVIDVARAALIAARSAQIMLSDADPDVQAKRAERLQAQTNKWVTNSTTRAGNSLARKPGAKADGPDGGPGGSAKSGGGGADASGTRQSWKSRMNDAFNPVQQIKNQKRAIAGGTDASGNTTKGAWRETMDMQKAYSGSKGQPVSQRLGAMQQAGGDGPAVSEQSMKRAQAYDQAKASQKKSSGGASKGTGSRTGPVLDETPEQTKKRIQGNVEASKKARESNNKGKGLADHSESGITSRSLEPAEIRKQAMSADFWDPKNASNRKAIRKGIEAKAARETDPKRKAALQKVADDMRYNEAVLHAHLTGKSEGSGNSEAVARITQESKLNAHGTAGPRGIQNVAKAEAIAGVSSANQMTDMMGFEKSYQHDVQHAQSDNFVAVIYRPEQPLVSADGKGMSSLVEAHGSGAIAYNNKKWGESTDTNLFGAGDDVHRNVETAVNTPVAPKKGATPQIHGSDSTRQRKAQLETLLGANQQKTTDGYTLTEDGHKSRQAPVTEFEQKRKATLGNAKNKTERSQRARNLRPEAEAVGRKFAGTKGDSVAEYYDNVTNHGSSAMNDGATPLNFGTAKTLDQYEHMPLVVRLNWDGQQSGNGTPTTPTPTPAPMKSGAPSGGSDPVQLQQTMRERMLRGLSNYDEAVARPSAKSLKDGVVDGIKDTAADAFTRNNLDGSDVVNGYGHQGAGGATGAGTNMGVGFVNNLFSSGAVDEQGNPVMETDKEGKTSQKRVSFKDQMLGMTGIAGQDAAGNSQHGKSLEAMKKRESEELTQRLAQFEVDYVSASGDLAPPPVAQESVASQASTDWNLYEKEIQSLQSLEVEIDPLVCEAETSESLLQTEKQAVEQMKPQIDEHRSELDAKKEKQAEADKEQDKLKTEGGALTENANKVLDPINSFVSPFQRMAGMIPSKISSSGAAAASGAGKLQSGLGDSSATGNATTAAADEGKTLVASMKTTTETATATTAGAESQMCMVESNVNNDLVETAQGKAELTEAKADARARIEQLEGKKAEAEYTHSGAVDAMHGWASAHRSQRTGHKAEGDEQMTALEAEVKKLQEQDKEAAAGGGGGLTGTAYASLDGPMPADAVSSLDSGLLSGGFALPGSISDKMEMAFGQDFSGVRIHTGGLASEAASGFNAEAFNFGSHIIFGSGKYRPGTAEGDSLLAHELTHVVQQPSHSVARGSAGVRLERPGSHLEKEASRVASAMKNASGASLEGLAKQAMRGGKPTV